MPNAEDVNPRKWTEIDILFDDGNYSVIVGDFEGSRCLGERWNGSNSGYGFPHQADKPLWHVIPHYFHLPILHKILDMLLKDSSRNQDQINLVIQTLRDFHNNNENP